MIYKYVILLVSIVKCISNPLCTGNSSYGVVTNCGSGQYLGKNWTCVSLPEKYASSEILTYPPWNTTFNCSETFSKQIKFNCSIYGVLNSWSFIGISPTPNGVLQNGFSCIDVPVKLSQSDCKPNLEDGSCDEGYGLHI